MESLLALFAVLSIPSAIGALAYIACLKSQPNLTVLFVVLALYVLYVFLISSIVGVIFIIVGAFFSNTGAWGHKKSTGKRELSFNFSHNLVFTATLLSFLVGTICLNFWSQFTGPLKEELFAQLYFLSLLISPSMTPFLIWAWKSSRLRPGMDKPFDD